jgi:hypothetical protein
VQAEQQRAIGEDIADPCSQRDRAYTRLPQLQVRAVRAQAAGCDELQEQFDEQVPNSGEDIAE